MKARPPKFFDWILQWYCIHSELEDIQGDYYEIFEERAADSVPKAKWLFVLDTLRLINPFSNQKKRATWLSESYHFNFRNQLNIIWRHIKKYPVIHAVMILGLSLALSIFFYISDYARFHNSFDQFHDYKDRVYRIVTTVSSPDLHDDTAWSHSLIKDVADEFPGAEQIVRLLKVEEAKTVTTDNKRFEESEIFFTDPEFAEVFGYKWVEGDPKTALREPNSVVLTEEMAEKYFDKSNGILGKFLSLNNESYEVTGVVEDIPANSDFQFDVLVPLVPAYMNDWMFVYVLLHRDVSINDFEATFTAGIVDYTEHYQEEGISISYTFENLADIHFSNPKLYDTPKVSRDRIHIFQCVAWIILIIALVNYINLYSTLLVQRSKTINIQSAIGATKKQIVFELGLEIFFYLGMALALALLMTWYLNDWISQYCSFEFFATPIPFRTLLYVFLCLAMVGICMAVYAWNITRADKKVQAFEIKPIKVPVRKGLIGLQFALSFALIVTTITIYRQTSHLQNQPLGFNGEQTVQLDFPNEVRSSSRSALKTDLKNLGAVISIAQVQSQCIPGMDAWVEEYYVPEFNQTKLFEELGVDDQYLKTLQIQLLSGENFSNDKSYPVSSLMVNRAFVDHMGWDLQEAIGKKLTMLNENPGQIYGVVENFYFNSPHENIKPMVLYYAPNGPYAMVRINQNADLHLTLGQIERVWNNHLPNVPFDFSFVMNKYNKQFAEEQASINVVGMIAMLVIFISALGMYGILLMLGKFREKEFGIRKVNGARQQDLFNLFSTEFLRVLVLSFLIVMPILWFGLTHWLDRYPIKTSLQLWVFGAAGSSILLLAAGIIFYQSARSYRMNTVDALKYE